MNSESLLSELNRKENNGEQIAAAVLQNPCLATDVMAGISSTPRTVAFKCAKILRIVSRTNPEMLYPYFDFFVNLLDNENSIIEWNAIDVIANLATVDSEGRFERVFNKYYMLLGQGSLITAAHVVENSGKIALAKPDLQERISREILKVAEIPLPASECRNIIAGKAIAAFSCYPGLVKDRKAVISFVSAQLNNTRNDTRKKAEAFLRSQVLS